MKVNIPKDWSMEKASMEEGLSIEARTPPPYRPLRDGEIIQKGDEIGIQKTGKWFKTKFSIGMKYNKAKDAPMRRPAGKG